MDNWECIHIYVSFIYYYSLHQVFVYLDYVSQLMHTKIFFTHNALWSHMGRIVSLGDKYAFMFNLCELKKIKNYTLHKS